MKRVGALACVIFLAAACAKPPGVLLGKDYKIYEAASGAGSPQLAVIDSASRSVERSLPLGALSPDGAHLYAVSSTTLFDFDPQTGAVVRSLALPGAYQLPPITLSGVPGGLSQNGDWLALESFEGPPDRLPTATHLLVISTVTWQVGRRLDLAGDFQYDAVTNNGLVLYLIQYLNSGEYNVRLFDLVSNELSANIVVDKADGNQAMAGIRLSGVASPDGHWLYSVYVREHESPFIHALSMDGPFAFCLDLPGNGYASANGSAEFHWSVALSRDGTHLYAANGALGLVAELEPATNYQPAVKRVAQIGTGKPGGVPSQNGAAKTMGANGAAVTPDGRTLVLSGDTGIAWVDATTLHLRDRALSGWTVWSVALSSDGSQVYTVNDAGMIAQISASSSRGEVSTFAGAPGRPLALVTVAGSGA